MDPKHKDYDRSSPIVAIAQSDYSAPQIVETHEKDYVTNGKNNEYFRFLIDLSISSPTLEACIEEISRVTYGKGLAVMKEEVVEQEDTTSAGFFDKMFGGVGKATEPDKPKQEPKMIPDPDGEGTEKINDLISPKDLRAIVKDRIILGQAAVKILYKGAGRRKTIDKIKHFPVQTLAPKKISVDKVRKEATKVNKDDYEFKGEVEGFFYHPRWEDYKVGDALKFIPAYGYGKNIEIAVIKDYYPNFFYWNPVSWSGGVKYALLEQEIADYLVNDAMSGFSPTTLININRDIESWDKREQLITDYKSRITGTKGDKTIIQFNSSDAEQTTFDQFPLNDAPAHYEYLASEASRKILTSFRVPEPKLLGIPAPGESGLGNNAKEIEVAFDKMQSTVIEPGQTEITDFFKELFKINGIEEDIQFIPVTPLDFDKYTERDAAEMQAKKGIDNNPKMNQDG